MGLYLGSTKVTPAIYDKESVVKVLPPNMRIDWDKDLLWYTAHPATGFYADTTTCYSNGETLDSENSNIKFSHNSGRETWLYINQKSVDLSQFSVGAYDLTASTTAKTNINISDYGFGVQSIPVKAIDSDAASLHYERYNFTNNITNLGLDGETTGTLNYKKYNTGTLLTYNKTINYSFDLNPSGNGMESGNSWGNLIAIRDGDSIVTSGARYASTFAKVSFTLTADTEVKVKYQISKSTNTSAAIIICPMDKNYTSFNYSSKLSNPVVDFSTNSDFEEKEYSFGTLSAGNHYYFVEFYNYVDVENKWYASITPYFEKIPIGKYLPLDITVTNSNDETPDYEYDPYTGKFKVPMTGNITVTAVGADVAPLTKLAITPDTWDVATSTLTWNYDVEGATYNILTPDGNIYTTTEKSFDLTGKLGESNGTFKTVKIWASTSNNASGKTAVSLMYNPNYDTNNLKKETNTNLPDTSATIIYENSKLLIYGVSGIKSFVVYDKETGTNIPTNNVNLDNNMMPVNLMYGDSTDKYILMTSKQGYFLLYNIETKTATYFLFDGSLKYFAFIGNYLVATLNYDILILKLDDLENCALFRLEAYTHHVVFKYNSKIYTLAVNEGNSVTPSAWYFRELDYANMYNTYKISVSSATSGTNIKLAGCTKIRDGYLDVFGAVLSDKYIYVPGYLKKIDITTLELSDITADPDFNVPGILSYPVIKASEDTFIKPYGTTTGKFVIIKIRNNHVYYKYPTFHDTYCTSNVYNGCFYTSTNNYIII